MSWFVNTFRKKREKIHFYVCYAQSNKVQNGFFGLHAEKAAILQITAENKKYPLRSLRCRGSSGARPYAPRMPCARPSGSLILAGSGRRFGHIDGARYAAFQVSQYLSSDAPSTSRIFHVVRNSTRP